MFEWRSEERRVVVTPPTRPKKMTATRFAAVLGLSPWSSPFEMWCEITKTYEKPFEETKYTKAGKVIEPKQIEYVRKAYFLNVQTPTDVYGEGYFKKTYGDFFKDVPIFGGMWDSLVIDSKGNTLKIIECKTTQRVEDWNGKIPEYYALQAALYAYLKGVDDVLMVASFLEEKDYEHPENFVPTNKNTIVKPFKVSQRYLNFTEYIAVATDWWKKHVETGVSPEYDEKKDAEILTALRTNHIDSQKVGVDAIIAELEPLLSEIEAHDDLIADKRKRAKVLQDELKAQAIPLFRDGDKSVTISGQSTNFNISRSQTATIDKKALEADGLLLKYQTYSESYRITTKSKN